MRYLDSVLSALNRQKNICHFLKKKLKLIITKVYAIASFIWERKNKKWVSSHLNGYRFKALEDIDFIPVYHTAHFFKERRSGRERVRDKREKEREIQTDRHTFMAEFTPLENTQYF